MKTAVVNRIINEKGEMLFLLRATKPFGWCLVGGKVDEGEVPAEACLRETREETGMDFQNEAIQVNYIGESESINGTKVHVFEMILNHTPAVVINNREHLNYRWIKTHDMKYKLNYTKEMRTISFAGKTLDFIDLGREDFVPDYLLNPKNNPPYLVDTMLPENK